MKKFLLLFAVVAVMFAGQANAGVIYQENFDGTGDLKDNGGPAVDNYGAGGNVWDASTTFNADGSVESAKAGAFLPFVPVEGKVYTLEATIKNETIGNWITVGFIDRDGTIIDGADVFFYDALTRGFATTMISHSTGPVRTYERGIGNSADSPTAFDISTDLHVRTVLDGTLADNPVAGNWHADIFVEDVLIRSIDFTSSTSSPLDITHVGFTRTDTGSTSGATISNLTLSQVPEPTSMALFGMIVMSTTLLGFRKRNRA